MLLINQKPIGELPDKQDEYKKGLKNLRANFGATLKFVRPGHPMKCAGLDSKGNVVPNMAEPSPPLIIPLRANVPTETGLETWTLSLGAPKLLPNGLWDASGRRSQSISEQLTISLDSNPELAFFLYYKSPIFKGGLLKIDDPIAEARIEGDKARADLDLQTALYATLGDEDQLKVIAQAYGVADVDKKHPDTIRKQLKSIVVAGDDKKRTDPSSRGVSEFLEELKVTDAVRLRGLVQNSIDEKKIIWKEDGRFLVGERELCKVPIGDVSRKFDYLCNFLLRAANKPKLKELLQDVVTREYLEKVTDDKMFTWLAKVNELTYNFKKAEDVKKLVFECYVNE